MDKAIAAAGKSANVVLAIAEKFGERVLDADQGRHTGTSATFKELSEQWRGHVAALVDGDDGIVPDQHHRTEAQHEGEQVETTDQAGGPEHGLPRGARIAATVVGAAP